MPDLLGLWATPDFLHPSGEGKRRSHLTGELGDLFSRRPTGRWEEPLAMRQDEDEPIREAVRCVVVGQMLVKVFRRAVGDDGYVRARGAKGRVLGECSEDHLSVPPVSDDVREDVPLPRDLLQRT